MTSPSSWYTAAHNWRMRAAETRALAELRGDIGARALLRRRSDRVVRVPMPSAAIDVDTPEDLLALEAPK